MSHKTKHWQDLSRRRDFLKLGLSLSAALGICPNLSFAQSEKKSLIKFGQSAPMSGALAKSATAFRDAVNAVLTELNAQGGVGGRSVELVTLDDAGRSETTATNIKLLASQHEVVGLFGFIGAGAHRVGALGAQQEGLPYIAPVSGAAELRSNAMPWVYTMRASHKDELQFIAKHTQQIGMNRIALVYEYNSQGWELRDAFSEFAKSLKMEDPALVSVDQEGSDFSVKDAVTAVLNYKPQCVVLGADYAASGKFILAARQAGFNGLFYTLSTVGGQALMSQLSERAAGISVTQVVPFPWSDRSGVGRGYNQFCQRNKLQVSFEGMEAWLASNLLIDALRKTKAATPAKLMAELDKQPSRDFGGFVGTLASKVRSSPGFVDLTVYSRDGKFRT
jgi:branched-chain amino acid transport system substrate-binding protein